MRKQEKSRSAKRLKHGRNFIFERFNYSEYSGKFARVFLRIFDLNGVKE